MNPREQSKRLSLVLLPSLISVGKSSKPHVPLKIYILLNERERRATHLSERTEIGREGGKGERGNSQDIPSCAIFFAEVGGPHT